MSFDIRPFLEKIKTEEHRNSSFLHLTANEAQMSETARLFLNSKLSERYFVGAGVNGWVDSQPFTMLGFPRIAELVTAAEEAAKQMLHASVINLNCLSGVHAMMCAILSTTEPGDLVMTLPHADGGHFATPGILQRVGRNHAWLPYDRANLRFDTPKLAQMYKELSAKAIYLDVSYYLNPHNLSEIRAAVGEDAIIIYDASHTMGLILGQKFQSPLLEGANVVCANTHKTLPGPQKGMVAFRDIEFGTKANNIINGSLYSSPHTHHVIALAVTLLEMQQFGQEYASQVISNSNALGKALADLGFEVRKANTGRFSENHQVHLFTDTVGDYRELYQKLYDNHIAVNFDDPLGERIYIRLGTQEVTRRGMKEDAMQRIAELLNKSFDGEDIRSEVIFFNTQFRTILFSFDQ